MTHSEYLGLINAQAALTAEVRALKQSITDLGAMFSAAFVEHQSNTERIVGDLPCRKRRKRCPA